MNVQATSNAPVNNFDGLRGGLENPWSSGMGSTDNTIPIEAWNTVLFGKFCRFRNILSHGLAGHRDELFRRKPYPAGARVLDVGCGFGDTTRHIAAQVGPHGQAVGVDCAENFIDLATREAAEAYKTKASFFVADAQCDDLRGPYDHVFSRFGTMFFYLPGLAMRNIRRALSPGGQLSMIVWRRREDNPWVHEAELCVKEVVPVVAHEDTDQVHCGPGPFSMAGPDMVSDMLRGAGYENIGFSRYDTDICIGSTLDDAVEFALALGLAGEIVRLAGETGERLNGQVVGALRETLSAYQRADDVWAGSSTWFVTARNPCALTIPDAVSSTADARSFAGTAAMPRYGAFIEEESHGSLCHSPPKRMGEYAGTRSRRGQVGQDRQQGDARPRTLDPQLCGQGTRRPDRDVLCLSSAGS
jgi:ubiquinone/menaquinone biosynthesis C-methylase UbiE